MHFWSMICSWYFSEQSEQIAKVAFLKISDQIQTLFENLKVFRDNETLKYNTKHEIGSLRSPIFLFMQVSR